jgi:hypothetical protein
VHKRIECGQVIAQGLAASAGRGYYHILPGEDGIQGFCLVAIKSGYPQRFQTCLKASLERVIEFVENCALVGDAFNMDNLLAIISQAEKVVQKSSGIHLQ